jgi:hypothetical protein
MPQSCTQFLIRASRFFNHELRATFLTRQFALSDILRRLIWLVSMSLAVSFATAQQTLDQPALPSQFDLFAGYSAWIPNATIQGQHLSNSRQGIIIGGAYYFRPRFGVELSGDYHLAAGNTSMRSVAIGPILRRPLANNFQVFAHALGGAAEIVGPPDPIIAGDYYSYRQVGPTWGPQFTLGGGLDWTLLFFHHRLTLRLLQADYVYQHYELGANGRANLNTLRLSSGIVFRIGEMALPAPVTFTCTAAPQNVFPGELLTVTGEASNLDRRKDVSYHWSGPGVAQGESNPAVTIDTDGLTPGTYRIGGQVSEGPRAGQSAHCSVAFRVMPMRR